MKSMKVPILCLLLLGFLDHVQALEEDSDGSAAATTNSFVMRGSSTHQDNDALRRILHQNANNKNHHHSNNNKKTDVAFSVDISDYSLRFEKCQGVRTQKKGQPVQRFAVFRLCPQHECASCNANYGEYTLPLEDYLEILSTYFHETKGALCETCQHCLVPAEKDRAEAKLEDFNSNCVQCDQECTMLGKLESNGYIDATDYRNCSLVHEGPNGEKHYAGPVCAQGGDAVAIGVFTDENCAVQDTSKDIREIIQMESGDSSQLTYSFMKLTYLETCLSCAEDGVEGLHDLKADQRDADKVKGFCENIYSKASKCETPHGFAVGQTPPLGESTAGEKKVCNFIGQVHSNKHSEPEQFIGDDKSAAEAFAEETVLDAQFLIMIIVGGVLLLLYMMFKCFCNSNASSYRTADVSGKSPDFDTDLQLIKVSVSGEDSGGTETEEFSSSSTMGDPPLVETPSD